MQENTLKMAAIRSGDTVTYISAAGHRLTHQVEGWKDEYGRRLLLLDNRTHITIDKVIERTRPGGCGAGVIRFEEATI